MLQDMTEDEKREVTLAISSCQPTKAELEEPITFPEGTTAEDYPIVAEKLPCADPDWRPLIPEWNEINIDVLGQALTKVTTTDEPIQPIMDEANEKARAIMEREGYYSWARYRQN